MKRNLFAGIVAGALFLLAVFLFARGRTNPGGWLSREIDHQIGPWEVPTPSPDRIVLTWSGDPATSFSVTWRTDATVQSPVAQIAVATPSPRFDRSAVTLTAATEGIDRKRADGADTLARYHSVTFSELMENTLYAYRVGDGDVWSAWFQTRTAESRPAPFSFIYFGDAQNDIHSLWSRVIRMAYTMAPDARFMVHAGDLINHADHNLEWGEWFAAGGWVYGMLPSVPIPGNHEYHRGLADGGAPTLSAHWRPQFTLPENGLPGLEETCYFVDYQGVRIVGLNSNRMIAEQAGWLDEVLATNPHRWALVTFHHPVFSSSEGRDNPELRAAWKPVLEKYVVDLVMQGHDHTYARGRATNESSGVGLRDARTGTVYVNSVSGPKMYAVREDRWDAYGATLERAAENTQLFQVIRVAGDSLTYRAYTATGDLYDAFALIKDGDRPNRFVSRPPDVPERTHENTAPY